MPQGGPSIPRDVLQNVKPGDAIDHRAFNAIVNLVRAQGAPPGRNQFEDSGQLLQRRGERNPKSLAWVRCESDDESVEEFSLLEIYDSTFDDDGPIFKVRKPESGAQLFGGNEDYAIAGRQGWVKLVTPYEAVIARCSEDVAFLDELSPDDDYGVKSGSAFTAMTSRDSRGRVMLLGKTGGGTGTTTLTDGCECSAESNIEGESLDGSPTICCTSHKRWRIDLGEVLGVKILYHLGGDVWSTWNDDEGLDNPIEIECYPDSDLYDVVLTITSTGATLELVARAALNCDAVCFEYVKAGQFNCQRANEFRLSKFSGISDLQLPLCLCISPLPRRGLVMECADCAEAAPQNIVLPQYIEVTIETSNQCCIPQGYCDFFNDSWILERQNDCTGGYGAKCFDFIIPGNCDGTGIDSGNRIMITASYGAGGATVYITRCGGGFGQPDCGNVTPGTGWAGVPSGYCTGGTNVAIFTHSTDDPIPWNEICSKELQWTVDEWACFGDFGGTDCDPPNYCRCGPTTITVKALGNVDLPEPTEDGSCDGCGA